MRHLWFVAFLSFLFKTQNQSIMRAILVGVLLTINITTFATTSNPLIISGTISNSSGEAMPAVIVEQCATNNYTLSDIDGCFELQLLPKKPQKITISFIGYQKQTIDLKKNSSNNLVVMVNSKCGKVIFNFFKEQI
jgi:hypothetical protein